MAVRALDHADAAPGTPVVDRDRCKGCGLCVEFCPFGHLRLDEELNVAGYHPALPEEAAEATAEPRPDADLEESAEWPLDPDHAVPAEVVGFEHNFAYWCLRCRYCEIVCPDAAIRLVGDVEGLEGTPGYRDRALEREAHPTGWSPAEADEGRSTTTDRVGESGGHREPRAESRGERAAARDDRAERGGDPDA